MKNLFLFTLMSFALTTFSCNQKNSQSDQTDNDDNGIEREAEATLYTNPVFSEDFPDPTVVRGGDDWFYAYATQSYVDGKMHNIQIARSKDLVKWERVGDALPEKPSWGKRDFWAPHVLYDHTNGKYYMYYSAESDDEQVGKCLGVAVADAPEGPFIDKGAPLLCGKGFVNIDPMAFDDPKTGKKLLYWGSGFEPIKVQELSDDRMSFKKGTMPLDVVFPGQDKDYNILIEGAWVELRNNKYYLFYSGDNCCGEKANYAVMVARADDPFGPFMRYGEANGTGSSVILEQKEDWIAPGHNSIIQDDAGQDWIIYHAIDPEQRLLKEEIKGDRKDRRIMLIDKLIWENGWPIVENKKPSVEAQESPVID